MKKRYRIFYFKLMEERRRGGEGYEQFLYMLKLKGKKIF